MYNILKDQFDSGKVLSKSKHFSVVKHDKIPAYFKDIYPLGQDYYHEMNPYFISKLYHPDLFRFADVFTVRDGYVQLANFILNNYLSIPKFGTKLFLIHPDLAKIVPPALAPYFGTWTLSQKEKLNIKTVKKVMVFGMISTHYLGNVLAMGERLKVLKDIPKETTIELYLPQRRNIFEATPGENIDTHLLVSQIKDLLPGRELHFLTTDQFFAKTDFKGTYFLDLAEDKFLVSDNYLHYYCLSKGATVSSIPTKKPSDSVFDIDLSFYHSIHFAPLPKVESIFTDLLFYAKTAPNKDFITDPFLHGLLKEYLK